jgi:transcription termination factor NusB
MSIKNKNNFFGRIYALEILLSYSFMENNFYEFSSINIDILSKIDIKDIFLDSFNIMEQDININLTDDLLKYMTNNYQKINQIREKYQIRKNESLDNILIIILNMAIGEYMMSNISEGIIISQYVNICSVFHNGTNLIHGMLDKIFKDLKEEDKLQNTNK